MTTIRTTPAIALAVPLADAKDTLRIEQSDTSLDSSITRWLKGVTKQCEHALNRSLVQQGWRLSLDRIAPDAIRLDHSPIMSVQSLKYYDADNVLQTLDPADYTILYSDPGYLVPADGKAWPETYCKAHAVVVDYTAGHGVDDTTVPENVQLYILARLSEQFDPATREFKETAQSVFVERLLDEAKVWG